jgi:hypothetical protein
MFSMPSTLATRHGLLAVYEVGMHSQPAEFDMVASTTDEY